MRISRIGIPAGLALACAGGVMLLRAQRPGENLGLNFAQPVHPVTQQMIVETRGQANVPAPSFHAFDTKLEAVDIGGRSLKRPQMLLFILDDCPCSVDAQPIFNALYRHFGQRVDFIGITNAGPERAKRWVSENSPRFPVVSDAKLAIVHAYQAKHSVYSALVGRDGTLEQMWPGYSVDLLQDMNQRIAAVLGERPRAFDTLYAPKAKTSGCFF